MQTPKVMPRLRSVGWVAGAIVFVGGVLPALGFDPGPRGWLLLAVASLLIWVRGGGAARPSAGGLAALMVVQMVFWAGLAAIVEINGEGADLLLAGLLLAGPVLAGLWAWLGRRGLEPSLAAKQGLGFVGLALACVCVGVKLEFEAALAGSLALAVASVAAASLGPASVAALVERSPSSQRGASLASWTLSLVLARALGGGLVVGELARGASVGASFELCLTIGFVAVALAIASSLAWRPSLELVELQRAGVGRLHELPSFARRAQALARVGVGLGLCSVLGCAQPRPQRAALGEAGDAREADGGSGELASAAHRSPRG